MTVTDAFGADPRNIFLTPAEVMERKRWARTRGYARMRKPDFPPLLDGAYRHDTIIEWENRQLAAPGWLDTPLHPDPAPVIELPAKRRGGRKADF
jgi:hypothetical protein